MTHHPTPADVVQEAMTWLGTPYHHGARVKGTGVDCGQLPAAVFTALGLVPEFEIGSYPHDWHLHRSEERYLGYVERFFDRVGAQPDGAAAARSLERTAVSGGSALPGGPGGGSREGRRPVAVPPPGKIDPLPADLALYKYGRAVSHGAIVIDWPLVIHAYINARAVVLDDAEANTDLSARFHGAYRLRRWTENK